MLATTWKLQSVNYTNQDTLVHAHDFTHSVNRAFELEWKAKVNETFCGSVQTGQELIESACGLVFSQFFL